MREVISQYEKEDLRVAIGVALNRAHYSKSNIKRKCIVFWVDIYILRTVTDRGDTYTNAFS